MAEAIPAVLVSSVSPQSPAGSPAVVRHFVHELRQPLSAMESIAHYLAIILQDSDSRVQEELAKLKQLVAEANGVLADMLHTMQAAAVRLEPADLNELILAFLTRHPLAPFEASGEGAMLVRVDSGHISHLLGRLIQVVRGVAAGEGLAFRTFADHGMAALELAFTASAPRFARLRDLMQGGGLEGGPGLALASMARILEVHGGTLELVPGVAGRSSILLRLPSA
jgi:hypothetical protein